jgi:hypothetical protein
VTSLDCDGSLLECAGFVKDAVRVTSLETDGSLLDLLDDALIFLSHVSCVFFKRRASLQRRALNH